MTLTEQRLVFTQCVQKLLAYAQTMGLLVTIDQVKRTQAEADANAASGVGIAHSLHLQGLAVDLLCYRKQPDGTLVYLNLGTEAEYNTLANCWKSLNPLNAWGGDFSKPDYDHYSSTRDGIR